MVHPTKSLASVGLAQARPNKHLNEKSNLFKTKCALWYTYVYTVLLKDSLALVHIQLTHADNQAMYCSLCKF